MLKGSRKMSKAEKRLKKLKERMDENAKLNQRKYWSGFWIDFRENSDQLKIKRTGKYK